MGVLEDLLVQEKTLVSHIQANEYTLYKIHVHIAELRDINRGAGTYNLPSEILSAIFEEGLIETPESLNCFGRQTMRFELLVSSVLRRWRNVALQTPLLWTDLTINVLLLTHGLYDLYLGRSKSCLLDITLDRVYPKKQATHDTPDCAECHLDQLISHVGHWRKLIVRGGFIELQLSTLSHLCTPALETLVLYFCPQKHEIELFSGGAPRLSSVELIGAKCRPPLGAVKYLTLFSDSDLSPLSYDQLSRSIEPTRSLTHLSIDAKIAQDAENHPPIELASVLVLYILFHRGDTDCNTLRILDFSAVKSLTIDGDTDVVIGALTRNHRVYPHVQSLTLTHNSAYNDTENMPAVALDFISLFPAIRDVVFQGTNPSAILDVLHNRKSTDEALWSDLSAITVVAAGLGGQIYANTNQIWACIVKIVENRVQLGQPISSIKLSSQIVKCGDPRQKHRLREQTALTEC
jgi:F-box-like